LSRKRARDSTRVSPNLFLKREKASLFKDDEGKNGKESSELTAKFGKWLLAEKDLERPKSCCSQQITVFPGGGNGGQSGTTGTWTRRISQGKKGSCSQD